MGGGDCHAYKRTFRRHGRADNGVGEQAVLKKFLPKRESPDIVSDDHGDDGRFGFAGVKSHGFKALKQILGIVPEAFYALRLGFYDVYGRNDGRG